jgi:4-hydroxybenzoate polyprenyltransferase
MDNKQKLKLIGYVVLAVLIANLILYALQLVNWIFFWGVIILGALFVYKILPKLREKFK